MEFISVSLFGHRRISEPIAVEERLERCLEKIIKRSGGVEFLIGREGDFDILAASVIRRMIDRCGLGNATLTLVLPYDKAEYTQNRHSFSAYYDDIIIFPGLGSSHFKAAIGERNRFMAERSDMVVCYVQKKEGGAYRAVNYAAKNGVRIINLAKGIEKIDQFPI